MKLTEQYDALVAQKHLKRECWLCGSTDLRIEVAETRFHTMVDARPTLEANETTQRATASLERQDDVESCLRALVELG